MKLHDVMKSLLLCSVFNCALADGVTTNATSSKGKVDDNTFDVDEWVVAYGPDFDNKKYMKKSRRSIVIFVDTNDANTSMESVMGNIRQGATTLLNPTEEEIKHSITNHNISRTGPIVFVAADIHDPSSEKLKERFNITEELFLINKPVLYRSLEMYSSGPRISGPVEERAMEFTSVTPELVVRFVFDLRNGLHQRLYASEPISNDGTSPDPDTGLRKIVGTQFSEVFLSSDKKKDIAFFAYLPNCEHCKKFRKELTRVIKLLEKRGVENIEFVEMDASKNEHPFVEKESSLSFPYFAYSPVVGERGIFRNFDGDEDDIQIFLQFYRTKNTPGPQPWNQDDKHASLKREWKPMNGNVKHLGDSTIDEFFQDNDDRVDEKKGSIVMFYAPWCKASQRAKNEFAWASKKIGKDINFGAVNCVSQDMACNGHLDGSFPVIKAFPPGDREGIINTNGRQESGFLLLAQEMINREGPFAEHAIEGESKKEL